MIHSDPNDDSPASARQTNAPAEFKPPVQRRSEQTLERLVDAARRALETKSFDRLTLGELTDLAGVTVGAFYQRFASKAALLDYLEREAYQQIRETGAAIFAAPRRGPQRPMRDLVRIAVTGLADLYREHRGVMRELVQRSRGDRDRQRRRMDMTREVISGAVNWLLAQGGPVGHPDPKQALRIALLFTSSALRDVILFDETWAGDATADDLDLLVDELVSAAVAYLQLPDESGDDPRGSSSMTVTKPK